jgi:hypothetical protein
MNNKGNIFDVFLILGIGFMIMLCVVVGIYLAGKVNTAIQDAGVSDDAKTMVSNINNDLPSTVDFIVLIILIIMPIVSAILAFFNNIHPLFFFVGIGMMLLIVLAGAAYKEVWEDTTAGELSATAQSMPMTNFVLNHFGVYSLLCGIIVLYGLYSKITSGGYSV